MHLFDLAHARSGDKGDIVDITVVAREPGRFDHLRDVVTPDRVAAHLTLGDGPTVVRHEVPQLYALKFVLPGALDGGVTHTLHLDPHGKCLSSCLLDMEIPEPGGERGMTIVAIGQIDVTLGDVDANLDRCLKAMEEAARGDAVLLVLPECALTGYVYDDRTDVAAVALPADDRALAAVAAAARRLGVTTVVGFLESDRDRLYNAAALATDDGRVVVVRKTHLPTLGVDRFVSPGAELGPTVPTAAGCIGVAICYDFRFPEVCRSLALAGAELVAVPVNWSDAVDVLPEHFVPVRAVENRIAIAVANRADRVGSLRFPGGSQVVAPSGERLVRCGTRTGPVEVATAVVDLGEARRKATVFEPGRFEVDVIADRRPELYQRLTEDQRDG